MPDFGIFRGFNEKLFGDKLYAGQLPTQLGLIGSEQVFDFLLLDDYPNAAAAYSLRKLRSAYTGDAIRVRRASDNTELDIGFVSNKLDTSALTTFCSGTNGFVKTWYDQSGNSRDATQATSANQPQIVSSGVVVNENLKSSINFGTNVNNWWLDLPSGTLSASDLLSYFHVARINTFIGSNAGVFAPSFDNSKGIEILQHDVINNPSYLRLNNIVKSNASNPLWTNNAQGMFSLITNTLATYAWNNANAVTLSNSTAMGILNFTGVYAIGRYAGGVVNVMSGNFQELIIYQIDQSLNQIDIQTNINDYYSIY